MSTWSEPELERLIRPTNVSSVKATVPRAGDLQAANFNLALWDLTIT